MNPQALFCPNMDCPARGQSGKGNIQVHSQKDKRCLCQVCGQTFTTTKGTIFYRLRHASELVIQVLVLLAYGCPIQAIVKAFGLDERTVRDWQARAGKHCQQVHEHLVESTVQDLKQVQADEIKVKTQKGTFWMALAIWVQPRLWIGGVVSPKRDLNLIQALADKVKQMALCRPLLLAVDGLASYVSAFRNAFRSKLPRCAGETGRCQMVSWQDIAIVQVVKQRVEGVLHVERRIVQGAQDWVERLIQMTQGKGVINTAFIERLNATFRQRISALTRRTRNLAQQAETLLAGMYLVGCFYNFCDFHKSLRLKLSVGSFGYRWVQRTPAIAAGLTDHQWTPAELFLFKVPPPRWELPKQRGRPSIAMLQLAQQWAT
jgi:transposase-like protein